MAREKGGPHYVWGICTNLDKDGNGNPCPNCKSKERIKLSIRDEFVCPECGEPLTKVKGPIPAPWKIIAIIAGAIVGVLAVAAIICCFTGVIPCPWGEKKPERIILKEKSFTLFENQSALIEASLEPEGAKGTFTYKSSDPKSVSITNGGKITALKKTSEDVIITVKLEEYPDVRESCKVRVVPEKKTGPGPKPGPPQNILVESISIKESDFTLSIGNSKQLNITVLPENHEEEISIVSSDESVATVSEDGSVKAVKAGTATITVKADKSGKEASVTVMVNAQTPPPPPQPNWARYSGERNKNGKPDGQGVLTITRSHSINGEMAQPGETITGVFKNGYLNMGKWNKKDGDVVIVKDIKIL